MNQEKLLRSTITEYESQLSTIMSRIKTRSHSEHLVRELRRHHDWTDGGARAVVMLANDYGAFVLRNALALAVLLGKEDGDLNF